ncbi:MAG: gamma-glutamyltransferase [Planctomycetota bacterium]
MGHGHDHQADHGHDHHAAQPAAVAAESNVVLAFLAGLAVALGTLVVSATSAAGHGGGHAAEHEHASAPVATGRQAAVATAAPQASKAALDVLARGGNAFDALVAASFVVSVVEPQSTGIGGGGFVLYHDAAKQIEGAIDGRETAPGRATPDMYVGADGRVNEAEYRFGPKSAGVPGLVAMLWEVHARHGSQKLTWADLVEPAIRYAREGFPVTPQLSATIAARRADLERYDSSRRVFLPDGQVPKAGATLRQPDLARTLEAIAARGAGGFYRGPVAQALAGSASGQGGLIGAGDLEDYRVTTPDVLRGIYRGHEVVSFPPPSSGGVLLIEMLNVLAGYELAPLGHDSEAHVHLLAEVMRRAYADRNLLADPAKVSNLPVKRLLSREHAAELRGGIDLARATPSSSLEGGAVAGGDHTTHISIVDAQGNAVASTQTVNTGLGSCFVAGDTGVLLNNEMNDFTAKAGAPNAFGLVQDERNLPAPGKRPLSSMTPTLVFDAQGRVQAVIGSPGGPKIISTVLQVVSNLIDFNLSPAAAMSAPRVHHQFLPDQLVLEGPLAGLRDGLFRRGHQVSVLSGGRSLGNAQLVVVGADGARTAVSDPRGEGRPAAN